MNKYADEFYATFQELARKYSAEKVWQDVIYACALTQSVFLRRQDKSGHEKIDRIMEQYSEKEQYKIISLYANIMDALQENPGQDFLGEMYHRLDLQKNEKGQFFTPYDDFIKFIHRESYRGNFPKGLCYSKRSCMWIRSPFTLIL